MSAEYEIPTSGRSRRVRMLSPEEELRLARAWLNDGDIEARDRIIIAYRPLALSIAATLAKQCGMNVEDLSQEAFLALAESIDKYNPESGNRFGTFARWHIQGQVRRHIMDFFGPCRIGTNLNDKKVFTQFRRLRAMIEARTGEPLDDAGREEIAETIGVSVEIVKRMEPRILRSDVSLDAPISSEGEEGESGSRMEMLIDEGPDPEELTMSRMDRKKVGGILAELIQELPDRERSIIHHRLLSGERMQLHELGEILGVTKERVRQIERKALKQLRQSLEERGFSAGDFIDGR